MHNIKVQYYDPSVDIENYKSLVRLFDSSLHAKLDSALEFLHIGVSVYFSSCMTTTG